jgi:hypothetical protein
MIGGIVGIGHETHPSGPLRFGKSNSTIFYQHRIVIQTDFSTSDAAAQQHCD